VGDPRNPLRARLRNPRKPFKKMVALASTRQSIRTDSLLAQFADQKPASGLAPSAGTIDRYRLQEWLTFIGTEIHKSLTPLFNPASSDDVKKTAKTAIANRLAYLNDQLAKRQYLMGDKFTVADAYAFTIVNWTNSLSQSISNPIRISWPTCLV